MGVDHLGQAGLQQQIHELWRAVRRTAKATLQNGSIGRAGLRVYDGGWIRIEGGGLAVTGTQTVTGTLTGSGTFDWTGPVNLKGSQSVTGPTTFTGTVTIAGALTVSGLTTLNNDLTLGSGRIIAGPLVIDKAGGYGARVYSTGTLLLDASGNVVLGSNAQALGTFHAIGNISTTGEVHAIGNIYGNEKFFLIDHPSKPDTKLLHGSLEGPEHGVYYRGVVEFDAAGEAVFELPDYFTALALVDDAPTVQVTAIGRPFLTGAESVDGGRVTIYGSPGREAHVTVTAARGRFDVEQSSEDWD